MALNVLRPLRNFSSDDPIWQRVAKTPDEHALAVHDVTTLNAVYAEALCFAQEYLVAIDQKSKLGLSLQAGGYFSRTAGTAFSTGLHAFAAAMRPLSSPALPAAIDLDELQRALDSMNDDTSALWRAMTAALGQAPSLDALFQCATRHLVDTTLGAYPELARARGQLESLLFWLMVRGAYVEFLYTRLGAERREGLGFLDRIVQKVTGRTDARSPEALRALEEAVGLPDEVAPWPRDHRCECGKSLDPYIFCCKPHEPFDLAPYEARLAPGFVLERACCGDRYEGFRCDACGRVYAWAKGVVDTVCEPEEADDE